MMEEFNRKALLKIFCRLRALYDFFPYMERDMFNGISIKYVDDLGVSHTINGIHAIRQANKDEYWVLYEKLSSIFREIVGEMNRRNILLQTWTTVKWRYDSKKV